MRNFKYALQLLLLERQHETASITSSIQAVDVNLLALLGVYQKNLSRASGVSFLQEGGQRLKGSVRTKCVRYLFEKKLFWETTYDTEQLINKQNCRSNRMIQVPALLIGALLSLQKQSISQRKRNSRRKSGAASREWDSLYVVQVGKVIEDIVGFSWRR